MSNNSLNALPKPHYNKKHERGKITNRGGENITDLNC